MEFGYKKIWQTSYPVLLSILMEHLIGMTDTAFLGRVGEVELGASAIATVYYLALFMLGFGFSIGGQIIMARRNGEKQYDKIGAIFYQGVFFLLGLAGVIFLVTRFLSPVILKPVIDSAPIYEATLKYLDWRAYGFFFSFMIVMSRGFFVGTTNTHILTMVSAVMVLSNVVLNYLLIFGKFGFPAMGIEGAALASSLSELIAVVFVVVYALRKVDLVRYGFNHFSGFEPGLLLGILKTSVWTMVQHFVAVSTWLFFFLAVESLGERPLAITNILRNLSSLPFMVTAAFAATGTSLVSNLIGSGKSDQVLGLCGRIIRISYLFVLPLLAVMMFFPFLVLRIYTDDISLIQAAIPAYLVMCSVYFINVPGNVLFHAVSGTGNTRGALLIEFLALAVYGVYVYYIVLHLRSGIAVCWTTEHVYALCVLVLSWLSMTRVNWRRTHV